MCLAMCLKKQEFQADCVYKLGVYKKKSVYVAPVLKCRNHRDKRCRLLRGSLISFV